MNFLLTKGLNWFTIYGNYKKNNKKLAIDLMELGLICSNPPKCNNINKHLQNTIKIMKANYENWKWECKINKCRCEQSFNGKNSVFRNMKKHPLTILHAIYMWINENKNDQIAKECEISIQTVTQWNTYWREVITLFNDKQPL